MKKSIVRKSKKTFRKNKNKAKNVRTRKNLVYRGTKKYRKNRKSLRGGAETEEAVEVARGPEDTGLPDEDGDYGHAYARIDCGSVEIVLEGHLELTFDRIVIRVKEGDSLGDDTIRETMEALEKRVLPLNKPMTILYDLRKCPLKMIPMAVVKLGLNWFRENSKLLNKQIQGIAICLTNSLLMRPVRLRVLMLLKGLPQPLSIVKNDAEVWKFACGITEYKEFKGNMESFKNNTGGGSASAASRRRTSHTTRIRSGRRCSHPRGKS